MQRPSFCINLLFFDSIFEGAENICKIVQLALDLGFVSVSAHFSELSGKSLQLFQITGMLSHLSFSILQVGIITANHISSIKMKTLL